MSSMMQWILYGVLILVGTVVGYYVGKEYQTVGNMLGAGIGAVAGALVSGAIWWSQSEGDGETTKSWP